MNYHSHSNPKIKARFGDALLASLASDGGLWMPDSLPYFSPEQTAKMGAMSFANCATILSREFVDERYFTKDLNDICQDAYNFDVPIVTMDGRTLDTAMPEPDNDYVLELFHGPTLAFKDFAARFMARAASHLMQASEQTRTILVATSGDTGGAIGDAFLNQEGVKVFILYPQGGVSKVQEQQLCTIGRRGCNVRAVAVDGTFDDCQKLVKDAFADKPLSKKHNLMSANSINVGRVIPQSFYYFWTSLQLKAAHGNRPLVYSIPSGNLGNLTGGLIAKKMGAPIDRFIIGNNANDPFIDYLNLGEYRPRPSVPTLSNAMDIGRPNNFPRILDLYNGDHEAIKNICWGASFTDVETERHMRKVYNSTQYIMCPHTTIGHLAMEEFSNDIDVDFTRVTVATAHPAKFADSVERILHATLPIPAPLAKALSKKKRVYIMKPSLGNLADYLAAYA
ncbi:MAG: threonine synthase [Litorimonas sp.]